MIEIKNLTKTYFTETENITAVNQCTLDFPDTGMFFIVGKSGCGKTSLLNLIGGLDNYDSGEIAVEGQILHQKNVEELDSYRNLDVGIIFQNYNLISDISVYENIEMALQIQDWKNRDSAEVSNKVSQMLGFVGLCGYENRKINELSGGEKQRIAIARSLIKGPKIILADEPTGNLDYATGNSVLLLLKEISKTCLVIVVTHDRASAYKYGDSVITIKDGNIDKIESTCNGVLSYNFTVKDHDSHVQEKIMGVCDQDVNSRLIELFDRHKNELEPFSISIDFDCSNGNSNQPDDILCECPADRINNREEVISRRLGFAKCVKLSLTFMKKKRFRLILSILLLAITIFLLLMSSFISRYNYLNVCADYLNRYEPSFLVCCRTRSYINNFYEENVFTLYTGRELYHDLENSFGKEKFLGIKSGQTLTTADYFKSDSDTTFVYVEKQNSEIYPLLQGRYPEAESEIAITDFLAKKLDLGLNDTVIHESNRLKVVGILKTDYIETSLERKLMYGQSDEFLQYDLQYIYNIAVLPESYAQVQKAAYRTITLSASNFFSSEHETRYLNGNFTYGNFDNSQNFLVCGTVPTSANEVIVSSQIAFQYGIIDEENHFINEEESYSFLDIYNEKYNGCYSDILNMSQFYADGLKIVGVFSADLLDEYVDVIVYSDLFKNISLEYGNYFFYDSYLIDCSQSKDYLNLVQAASKADIMFNEPAIMQILNFRENIIELLPILNVIVVLVSILTLVTIFNYISTLIKENSKNIGILKSLGITRKDITIVFLLEIMTVYVISSVFAILITNLFLWFTNYWYQTYLLMKPYNIITWNHSVSFFVYILTLIAMLLFTYAPIRKISQKKPVEIIRDNE